MQKRAIQGGFKPRLTQEHVQMRVDGVSLGYRESLLELLERASRAPEVGRLELDIAPSFAAVHFPIVALEWSKDREDVPVVPGLALTDLWSDFRSLGPLLPGFEHVPIGRADIGGLDFTPEANWIFEALLAKTRSIWTELEPLVPHRLDLLVGRDILGADADVDFNLLNLRTARWDSCRNVWH
jgi:hypothetical protein